MTITVNSDAGLVWIRGEAHPTNQTIARLVALLQGRENELVTYGEIEQMLGIEYNTRVAYLRDARKILDGSGSRIRVVRGHGVVFEQIAEAVVAA